MKRIKNIKNKLKKIYKNIYAFCRPSTLLVFDIKCRPEDTEGIIKELENFFDEPFDTVVLEIEGLEKNKITYSVIEGYNNLQLFVGLIMVSIFLLVATLLTRIML